MCLEQSLGEVSWLKHSRVAYGAGGLISLSLGCPPRPAVCISVSRTHTERIGQKLHSPPVGKAKGLQAAGPGGKEGPMSSGGPAQP